MRISRTFDTYGPRMRPGDGRVVSNFLVAALAPGTEPALLEMARYATTAQLEETVRAYRAVTGREELRDHNDAADRAQRRLHREVNATIVSPARWASGDEPFLAEVRSRPLVALQVGGGDGR